MTKSEHSGTAHSDKSVGDYQEKGSSALARIFWMLIGNVILIGLAIGIYKKNVLFSFHDTVYWITVSLLIIARYCDIRYLGGRTAEGQPACIAHWRKYTMVLLLIAAGVWLLAHTAAMFFHK